MSEMKWLKWCLVGWLAAGCAVTMTACGSDDDDDDAGSSVVVVTNVVGGTTVVVTNVAPGATNHLEGSASLVQPAWTNIHTWRGREPGTNYTGTATTQGWFRIRTER